MVFAEVAVQTDIPFRQAFTYRVPDGMDVHPGSGVVVPWGRDTRPGVVVDVRDVPRYDGATRDVLAAAGGILAPEQIALAHWLSQRYLAPLYPCVALMLPPGFARRLRVVFSPREGGQPDGLSPEAAKAWARLVEAGAMDLAALRRRLRGAADSALAELRAAGLLHERLALTRPERPPAPAAVAPRAVPPRPTPSQTAAISAVRAAIDRAPRRPPGARPEVFLLHGVTGSGKTEVYLSVLEHAVARGRRGILLVPEIALTPQMAARLEGRFPGRVAVLHSGLTDGERERLWHAIRAGAYDVVAGPRSATFAPLPDLGVIIVDEEHEWTYKQHEGEPRYHARDVALRRAQLTGATVLLGSATPDVVTAAHALAGHFTLLSMPERVTLPGATAPVPLPSVEIIDLVEELKAGNTGIFSRALTAAMEETLARGEQILLYLNKRGSASFLLCRDCGHTPQCSGCLTPLAVHEAAGQLRCHLCNRRRRLPGACPLCESRRLRPFGLGTQKVEEEVQRLFPTARVLRWDRDAATSAEDHAAILGQMARGEADIVVGTQMVAKGHDLPNITLVGVVSADIALNMPDFRGGERAYQLLTQVAGRAGRGERPGRVIVQTYSPEHYAIRAAAEGSYEELLRAELAVRREAGYPPYTRLARLLFSHTSARYAETEARRLAEALRRHRAVEGIPNAEVTGPSPAFHERIRGRWRWQIVLRAHDPAELIAGVDLPRGWSVDIDPVTLI